MASPADRLNYAAGVVGRDNLRRMQDLTENEAQAVIEDLSRPSEPAAQQ
jgi:hypothetical protein